MEQQTRQNLEFHVRAEEPKGWQYNRPLAALILAVVVLCSVLLGVGKGVRGQYRQVTEALAKGTDGSGYGVVYYEAGMEEHASSRCKVAARNRYGGVLADRIEAVESAVAEARRADTAGELYDAAQRMIDAVEALNLEMREYELQPSDEELRASEYQQFTDQTYKARNVAASYNELARRYNDKVLGSFPAGALAGLLSLPKAEEYS